MNRRSKSCRGVGTSLAVGAAALGLAVTSTAQAREYDAGDDLGMSEAIYELAVVDTNDGLNPAVLQVDLDYVAGMGEHHRGALVMAEEYLARGENPVLRDLARTIMANQAFEIGVLESVLEEVEREPRVLASFGDSSLVLRPVAVAGLEHTLPFVKSPPPSMIDYAAKGRPKVSAYDVQWAKGMIVHHAAALDMARDYNADPSARNRFLRRMNLEIIQDQTYEIGFLEAMIARYPGDADTIEVDESMIHGMEMHGGRADHDDGRESGHGNSPAGSGGHGEHR